METQNIALAEALLRRKELQQLIDRLSPIRPEGLFVTRVKRINVADNLDEVTANVPVVTMERVDAYHNFLAKQLRAVDAAIQKANWDTVLTVPASVLADFSEQKIMDNHPDSFPKV